MAVKSGGCAGMSYVMEYAKEVNPNDEVIEDKGVKVFIDAGCSYVSSWNRNGLIRKKNFLHHLYSIIPMKLSVVGVESHLKFSISLMHICIA